jgi:hypothetical protein
MAHIEDSFPSRSWPVPAIVAVGRSRPSARPISEPAVTKYQYSELESESNIDNQK